MGLLEKKPKKTVDQVCKRVSDASNGFVTDVKQETAMVAVVRPQAEWKQQQY